MKLSAPVLKTLLMAASLGMVVPVLAQTAPVEPSVKEDPIKPDDEPEPVLPGVAIPRGDRWLSLSIEQGTFRLGFYDAKKKPIPADVARANARWNSPTKIGELRAVLNLLPDGSALRGNKPAQPPYAFKVYLTLLGEDGKAVENYVVDFKL